RMPIGTFNWDYAKNEGQIRDLVEHRTTSFLVNTHFPMSFEDDGTMKSTADWGRYDVALVRKLHYARKNGGIIIFSYGIVRDFDRRFQKKHGWKFMDEAWQKAFKSWVLEFERHLKDDLGMAHNEYTVQLWDEATHGNAELTVRAGMYMRSFAPEISTCMDGAQNPDEIRAMDPVIDFWIPHQSTLYGHARAKEIRALYKQIMAKGEPVWTYTCSTNMKALSPLDYYRLKEWRVWDLGMQGSCYWAYNSWRGDPWDDFDGTIADCGSIYDGPHGAITSRRWESTLDGREDYLCLHLLREAGRRAGGAVQAKIEEFIAQSVKSVLEAPKDIELFRTVRSDLLAELAKQVGAKPPSLKNPPTFTVDGDTLLCRLTPDRPVSTTLYYRVPGYDSWRSVSAAESATPLLTVRGLTRKRTLEWYLLFHDRTGASAAALGGLPKAGHITIP
ncbi:MAG: DUF4091 domain-containing protein, partial [Lentisphaeria bacterium]|nr:DUF4091 domain-containing protein [Lentisphaeria bacterium]